MGQRAHSEHGLQARIPITGIEYRPIDDLREMLAVHSTCFGMSRNEAKKEFSWMRTGEDIILIGAYHRGIPVGYTAGIDLELVMDEPFVKQILPARPDETLYLRRLACLPEYQGNGIARTLASLRIDEARHRGYRGVAGHIRNGPALVIAERTIPRVDIELEIPAYGRQDLPHTYITGEITRPRENQGK